MRFQEEIELNIHAPIDLVWKALQDFDSWPKWAIHIKAVSREGEGWRFRAKGQPPVDLIWVARHVVKTEPSFLEFVSVAAPNTNMEFHGSIKLEATSIGTHLAMEFDGKPHYDSPILDKAADWYASVFGEPSKILKVTFEQFKNHVESQSTIHQPNLASTKEADL